MFESLKRRAINAENGKSYGLCQIKHVTNRERMRTLSAEVRISLSAVTITLAIAERHRERIGIETRLEASGRSEGRM